MRRGVGRSPARIHGEQVLDEREVVGEALMRVQVHLPVQGSIERSRIDDLAEIAFEPGPAENPRDLAGQFGKIPIALETGIRLSKNSRNGHVLLLANGPRKHHS